MTAPALDRSDPLLLDQIMRRAGRPDFDRWADQVERCGHCSRPVRLRGVIKRADGSTYSTDSEPDRVLLKRCGNRRASVCPSCSYEYAGDMWQLLYAGAAGGRKGVPESVRTHPLVFATLTAPGFGAVHGTRTGVGTSRCRPAQAKPTVCKHGRPMWCNRIHTDDDPRLGEPLCGDCYDYPAHAAFNWWAPELWRRFTITVRRVLARRAGLTSTEFQQRCRLSFVKVAEYQRRAVVHFHALIRLDAASDRYEPPPVPLTVADLANAVEEAVTSVRLTILVFARTRSTVGNETKKSPEAPQADVPEAELVALGQQDVDPEPDLRDSKNGVRLPEPLALGQLIPSVQPVAKAHAAQYRHGSLRFGSQVDVQMINGDHGGELTAERAAAYIAKYATKSAEDFGLGDRRLTYAALKGDGVTAHVARLARTCWDLGALEEYDGIRRWVHMLGFRGHFASKSRRYSTTLGAIRSERRTFRRRQAAEQARQLGLDPVDDETTLVVSRWEFAGIGYLTGGDTALALSAAARARERREAGRDHIHTETAKDLQWTS